MRTLATSETCPLLAHPPPTRFRLFRFPLPAFATTKHYHQRMADSPLILVRADAVGVLGEYAHTLEIPVEHDFTIIYGPNGVGKTKFLEILHATSRIDGRALSRLPFASVTLSYVDGSSLRAERLTPADDGREDTRGQIPVQFELSSPDVAYPPWVFTSDGDFADWLLEATPWRPLNSDLWEDISDGEVAPISELEQRYAPQGAPSAGMPDYLREFSHRAATYLIETQRLRIEQKVSSRRNAGWRSNPGRQKPSSRIIDQAAAMRSLINAAQTEHSRITQQLDRTFPNRVLTSTEDTTADDLHIRQRYNAQNEFRSRLGRVASVALEDALSLPERELLGWERQLLSLYLDDADKKLAPFESLLRKIELLESIVGSRLLKKRLQVTAGEGLTIIHERPERPIDLDSLSSGEQHEIILMFDLLFNVPEGAIVMIDEPEISLHVIWQLGFIPDVRRIAELAGFRFIVATHSPQIINDAWDRAVRLGPPEVEF